MKLLQNQATKRIISSIILLGVGALFLFLAPRQLFGLLISAVSWLGLREYLLLTLDEIHNKQTYYLMGLILGGAVSLSIVISDGLPEALMGSFMVSVLIILSIDLIIRRNEIPMFTPGPPVVAMGIAYSVLTFSYITLIRYLPDGRNLLIFLFLVSGSRDGGAWVLGRLLKTGYLLAPTVNPRKTVQGSVAAFVFSLGVALGFKASLLPSISTIGLVLIVIVIAVGGQIGDLVESLIKRVGSAANSSDLIPGEGGILDFFDSVLFVAPVIYYIIIFLKRLGFAG